MEMVESGRGFCEPWLLFKNDQQENYFSALASSRGAVSMPFYGT